MCLAGLEFVFFLAKPLYIRLLFALPMFLISLTYGVFQIANVPVEQRVLIIRYVLLIHGCALCILGIWYKTQSDLIKKLNAEKAKLLKTVNDDVERNHSLVVRLGLAMREIDELKGRPDD
jgi:hypothetical protein